MPDSPPAEPGPPFDRRSDPGERPNVARMYDYLLGHASNIADDRERAGLILDVWPDARASAAANRTFLRHAVQQAIGHGIDQFLDLGSGIPTVGNVHEIALAADPEARVAYVDNEPVAVTHTRTMLADLPTATIAHADLRHPDEVLAAPAVAELLDLDRPLALLAVTAMHFASEDDDPAAILAAYRTAMAPGSVLALSHSSDDYPEHPEFAAVFEAARALYSASTPMYPRTRARIRAMVEDAGFTVNADGLTELGAWTAAGRHPAPLGGYALITRPLDDEPAGCASTL